MRDLRGMIFSSTDIHFSGTWCKMMCQQLEDGKHHMQRVPKEAKSTHDTAASLHYVPGSVLVYAARARATMNHMKSEVAMIL